MGDGKIKHHFIYYLVIYHVPFIFCGAKLLQKNEIRKDFDIFLGKKAIYPV